MFNWIHVALASGASATIWSDLETAAEFSELVGLINGDAAYADVKTLLENEGATLTLFAPNNAAFNSVPDDFDVTYLQYHALESTVLSTDLEPLNFVATAQGQDMQIKLNDGSGFYEIIIAPTASLDATIVTADAIVSSNGIVHEIDTILTPPADPSVVATNAGLTSLVDALVATDLATTVDTTQATIFAPANAAFDVFGNLILDGLAPTLLYHVVPGAPVYSSDLGVGTTTTVTTANGVDLDIVVGDDGSVMVNGASVTATDIMTSQGVVHLIDAVLPVPTDETSTIYERMLVDPDFYGLTNLLETVEYADVKTLLQNEGATLTLFAPDNAAFNSVPDDFDVTYLQYHALESTVLSTDLEALNFVATAQGQDMQIKLNDGSGFYEIIIAPTATTDAEITATDIVGSNGVIHVIDSILTPPAAPSSVANASGVLNGLVDSLVAFGLADFVDMTPGTTIFAPADPAFDDLMINFENADLVLTILSYHVATGILYSSDLTTGSVPSVVGSNLDVVVGTDGSVMVNDATVVVADVLTSTGVVHVVDSLILFPCATEDVTHTVTLLYEDLVSADFDVAEFSTAVTRVVFDNCFSLVELTSIDGLKLDVEFSGITADTYTEAFYGNITYMGASPEVNPPGGLDGASSLSMSFFVISLVTFLFY
jgi:uncharacterized surface protein with fasciclin (FAS1) repeats